MTKTRAVTSTWHSQKSTQAEEKKRDGEKTLLLPAINKISVPFFYLLVLHSFGRDKCDKSASSVKRNRNAKMKKMEDSQKAEMSEKKEKQFSCVRAFINATVMQE